MAQVHCKAVIRLQHNYTVNCSKADQGLLNSAKREGDSAVGPFCQKKRKQILKEFVLGGSHCGTFMDFQSCELIPKWPDFHLKWSTSFLSFFFFLSFCDSFLVTCNIEVSRACMEWSEVFCFSVTARYCIFFQKPAFAILSTSLKMAGRVHQFKNGWCVCVCVFCRCCFCKWMD